MKGVKIAVVIGIVLALAAPTAALAAQGNEGSLEVKVTIPQRTSGGDAATISNAQLRWGLSVEAGAGAFAGECNFLSAGTAGDATRSREWTEADGFYRAEDGPVRIEKPTASGGWQRASFADKCKDPEGNPVTSSSITSASGNQVVIDGGRGRTLAGGGVELDWAGSFTVVFYGGLTYWSVSDVKLRLDASGSGRLIGTASGYGAKMGDTSEWSHLPGREIVLADIGGADVRGDQGFSVIPAYLGVQVSGIEQVREGPTWGSFPQSFIDFQLLTGQAGYWLSTGGVRDRAKPATTVYVSYRADAPIAVPTPPATTDEGDAPENAVLQRPGGSGGPLAAVNAPSLASFVGGVPLTFVPEREGIVPNATGTPLPAVVAPLLGTALALLAAIVAVLNMMGVLPWQKPPVTP